MSLTADEIFRGRLVMAPMSRGTDLPCRRLATEWGAEVCVGEMAYAHKLVKRERSELALIRRHVIALVPQTYNFEFGGRPIGQAKQNLNFFVPKMKVDFTDDKARQLDRRLALAAVVLLMAVEGRQG